MRRKELRSAEVVSDGEFMEKLIEQILMNPYRLQRRADLGCGKYAFIHHFDPAAIERLCAKVGLVFQEALVGGRSIVIGGQDVYGHVIETDSQRCFLGFHISKEFRPEYSYRDDPIFLYSFPGGEILATDVP